MKVAQLAFVILARSVENPSCGRKATTKMQRAERHAFCDTMLRAALPPVV
jgi:hypothetical protein